jgi:HK97 family phage major capsid protein
MRNAHIWIAGAIAWVLAFLVGGDAQTARIDAELRAKARGERFPKINSWATFRVWVPAMAGGDGDTLLEDRVKEITSKIGDVRKEAQVAWSEFEETRTELANSDADYMNPESEAFKVAEDKHKAYATKAEELQTLEGQREALWAMTTERGRDDHGTEAARRREEVKEGLHAHNIGDRIVASEGYKALLDSGVLESNSAKFNQPLGEALTRPEFQAALVTGASDTSGGALITADRRAGFTPYPSRPLRILELITIGTTDSDLVEYVKETAPTNNAAETAEATAATGTSGTKPESAVAFLVVQEAVRTLAHWVPATRRALADAGQLRTMIEGRLGDGLLQRVETQVAAGNGVGENLRGIYNTVGIAAQPAAAEPAVDTIHRAITLIRLAFQEPNAVGIHPLDWEDIRLSKNGNDDYYYGPPAVAGTSQVWGVGAAIGTQFTEGLPLVGDYSKATLWLREGVQILASDSHADFFVRNLVVLLAEMRLAFGVEVPAAFATADLTV